MIEYKTIKEIAEILRTGKTPPTQEHKYFNGGINWYSPGDLNNGKFLSKSSREISELAIYEKKAVLFPPKTLLIGCIGDIGKIGITSNESSSNQQLTGIFPNDTVNVEYLYYWFFANKKKLENYSNNAVVPILNNATLEKIQIPLPPLEEQKRLAAILDAADLHRQKTKALLDKYDQLAQALFLDMFGDPVSNPKGWVKDSAINYCNCIVPGRDKPKSFSGNITWITTTDLNHLGLTISSKLKLGLTKNEIFEVNAKIIPKGSVILTCVGDLGVISITDQDIVMNQQLHSFQCSEKINNYFLMYSLSFQKEYMYKMASSTTVPYMNKSVVNSIPTILPPLDLQNRFMEKILIIQSQKSQAEKSLQKAEELFQSLLQKAFKGEL